MSVVTTKLGEHFCSIDCSTGERAPCDLCLAQRKKMQEDELRKQGKPTLQHNPFAAALAKLKK